MFSKSYKSKYPTLLHNHFVFAITDDIPKFDIGPEIPKQTRNDVEALLPSPSSPQKDGSPRVCIDFRKLNRVLVKDHYPLPLIEDILDKLQDTRVFSTIDLPVIDSFTKFVWLYPTKTTSTSEVIKKLDIQKTTFGNPRFLITDRGTTFTSDEFHTYCSEQKITLHHITTACLACSHPRMPRAHQAGFSRRFLAGVRFFESVRSHGPGIALLANGGVQQQHCNLD
ncbi:integrase catalytic domain-containing protein [Trichonephila clavipes]|nr:integrase catalytic domain-containing protein [Trichonephila clavipes]